MPMDDLECNESETDKPYATRSAMYDKYAGRTSVGWVFAMIDSHLNGPAAVEKGIPNVRTTAVVAKRWNGKINGKSRLLYRNTGDPGQEYAVWIVDCAAMHAITGQGWEHGWRVSYCAKNRTFGGSGHWDTWDEAIQQYDDLRGEMSDQLTLL